MEQSVTEASVGCVSAAPTYIPRLVDSYVELLLDALPAIMLVGPRAGGKTTTGSRLGSSIVRLDRRLVRDAVEVDPDAALTAYDEPVVIDEWQLAPDVLGAVKRAVDQDPSPGRFILTGSTTADLTTEGWPATGRVVRVPLWQLVQRELVGDPTSTPFIDRLFADGTDGVAVPTDPPDVRGYLERALWGAFPEVARQPNARVRRVWLSSYIDELVSREVGAGAIPRDPVRLRRYLQAVAANTAGLPEHRSLYDAAEIARVTASAYDGLLEALFVVDHVPAWARTTLGSLKKTPKRYLTDPALLGPLLGVDVRRVLRDADLLGRVIDTFVAAQLRAELPVCETEPRMFHVRDAKGRHEVDLVLEASDGRVAAFEIKSGLRSPAHAARHLVWLRDHIGDQFAVGVVFHTGPLPRTIGDRIIALPICAIWG